MRAKNIKRVLGILTATVVICTAVFSHLGKKTNDSANEAKAAAQAVSRVCCHDPSVVKANGQYYIFGSHMSWAKSSNLSEWSSFTNNINNNYASIFSVGAAWAATNDSSYDVSGNLWAPDVIYNPTMGKWCMYMSINGVDWNSSIAMATADSVEGPYTYAGTVVYSGFNNSTHPVSMTDYGKVMGYTSSTTSTSELNSNSLTRGTYTSDYTYGDFTIGASSSKYISVEKASATVDGTTYSLRLKMNGAANSTGRYIKFTTTGAATVDIVGVSTSTSKTRVIRLAKDSVGGTTIGEITVSSTPGVQSISVPSAGTYYLYSTNSGICVYNVKVSSTSTTTSSSSSSVTVDSRYLSNGAWNSSYGTNAIDPCVFYDQSGNLWMVYGSWFGGIFMLQLDESTGLRDYNVRYGLGTDASDGIASDPYMGTRIAGGMGASGEAPYIIYNNGYYYLFVSYGGFASEGGYNMRVFRSSNPDGPYTDAAGNVATYTYAAGSGNTGGNVGIRLMSYYRWSCMSQAEIAQGHNSALVDDDGKMYVVYHTRFNDGYEFHEVRTHQLFANQDGWLVAAPYEYLGETISSTGYSSSDMVGTYEFLVQEPSAITSSAICTSVSINLNSDGTVTGGITGNWSYTSGKAYMTLTYNGVTYKGVFLKQYDESASRNEVMTFTAVGSNNICIWGSKGTGTSTGASYTEATIQDGIYYLKNVNSGKYLDVANGSGDNGTNIQQWSFNGADAQKFQIKSDGNGYYYILTGASGYTGCVDIDSGSSADGANVLQWEYWGGDMQKYKIAKNSDGSYSFLTKASGCNSALDVYNMSADDGANVCQWSYWGGSGQSWVIESALESASIADGEYYIKNVNSGLYMDVANASADDGANVQQWEFNGCAAQVFKIQHVSDGWYSILTGASGYASGLDVYNGSSDDGTNIDQWTYWGGDMQLFKIVQNADGTYSFLSKSSNGLQAVEVYAFGTANGDNVSTWGYWGGAAQSWTLEKATSVTTTSDPYAGVYYIKNVNSGKYLDVANGSSSNNANIQQWTYNGCFAQKFEIVPDGNGYYYILTGASDYSKCVDIAGGKSVDGTNVCQYTYKGSNNQKYKIVENNGNVAFLSVASSTNAALDVYNMSGDDGANVCQWSYWGGAGQLWTLEATTK